MVLLWALLVASAAEEPTTLTYRSSPTNAPWAAARFTSDENATRHLIRRSGGFAPAPPLTPRTYDWLRPGAWASYLARVYGSAEAPGLPTVDDVDVVADVGGLLDGLTVDFSCPERDDVPFKRFNWHAPYNAVHYFRRRTAVDAPPAALANGTWAEVSHCGGSKFEAVGAFFYVFRGSGLYVNVGATLAFETHLDASLYFLGRPCGRAKPSDEKLGIFQCDRELPLVVAAARDAGYDSLQFTHHCDAFCEGGSMRAALTGPGARSPFFSLFERGGRTPPPRA